MKYFKEYYPLFFKTFRDLWKSGIDWKAYSIEVLSSVVGGIVFIYSNGENAVMENISGFVLSVFAFPGILAFLYSAYKLIMTPVEIYKSQIVKFEPYDWSNVGIVEKPFNILGLSGWGIEVINNKGIALENVSIWYVGKREGQEETKLGENERLGFINFKSEKIQFESTVIEPNSRVFFVITSEEYGMPIPCITTEKKRHYIGSGFQNAIDIVVKAKTMPYTELAPQSKRLNIFPDGMVLTRPAT